MTFCPDSLLAKARERTGLDDFGPDDFREPFEVFVKALGTEAQIAPDKVERLESRILRLLENRLWFARDLACHPEILEQDLGTPIVITSLPRTGSTKLHRLLAASGDFMHLDFWQVHMPSRIPGQPGGGMAARMAATQEHEDWMYRVSPEILAGHPQFTEEAEECQWLMEQSFRHAILFGLFETPSYLGWLMQSDPMPAFAYYRTQLQYLQWQAGGRTRPWLLKSPTHFGIEPLLESLFGAIVPIITHRDPCRLIPSITSTSEAVRKLYSQRPPGEGLATALTQMFAGAAAMHIAWRDQRTVPALDLAFGEVAKDSDSAIKSVYDFLGMDLTSESLTRIHAWEADESRNRHASITTSASEHGITEDEIRSAFAAYGERFAEYL